MFIGHFAPALAAAAVSRRAPKLGMAFIAAQLVDWAFFTFAIVGVENMRIVPGITAMNPLDLYDMPYTHSLAGAAVWAAVFGLIILIGRRDGVTALFAAAIVLSHWALDWLVHRPDLTIAGGEHKYGLGLWDMPFIAMPLEVLLITGAWVFYVKKTRGPALPPVILLVLMLVMQGVNWFGPEPPAANIGLYLAALASFALVTITAMWVGSTRKHKLHLGMSG